MTDVTYIKPHLWDAYPQSAVSLENEGTVPVRLAKIESDLIELSEMVDDATRSVENAYDDVQSLDQDIQTAMTELAKLRKDIEGTSTVDVGEMRFDYGVYPRSADTGLTN